MPLITFADMPAGSVYATDKIAYIKTGDGKAHWNGTDGKRHDNADLDRLFNQNAYFMQLRIGRE